MRSAAIVEILIEIGCSGLRLSKSLLGLDAEGVCRSIQRIRSRLLNPARSMQEMIGSYEAQGLANSAGLLRTRLDLL